MSLLRGLMERLPELQLSLEEYGRSGDLLLSLDAPGLARRIERLRPLLAGLREDGHESLVLLFRPEETIEFLVAALAAFHEGLVIAPFYPNWPEATQREYLEAYGFRAVAVGAGFRSRAEAFNGAGNLRLVPVDLGPEPQGEDDAGGELPSVRPAPAPEVPPDRVCAWIFTSGTSGKLSKLTELTFGNVEAAASNIGKLEFLHEGMTVHNPLSVSHIFAFVAMLGFLTLRPRRVLFSDVQYLARLPESRIGKVDGVILVPVVIHRMRAAFYEKLTAELDGSKVPPELRKLARVPLAARRVLKRVAQRAEQAIIDLETTGRAGLSGRAAISTIRGLFGKMFRQRLGSPEFIVVGGARPNLRAMAFVEVLGIRCLQGWGMTETTGPLCVCELNDRYRGAFGTCGTLFDGTRASIEEGELVVEGAQVARGYREPDGTCVPFGGRKATGDQAEFDSEGRLRILGKASDRITTANGLNYSPIPLEDALFAMDLDRENLLEQVVVIGDGQPSLGAVFFLRETSPGTDGTREYVGSLVRAFNEARTVDERIGAWALHPQPLRESSFLGPTGKLRRPQVEEEYARIFD